MTETILHNDWYEVHEAWCEEVARLREALAKQIHKRRSAVATVLQARSETEDQILEWNEECGEEIVRLREELERLRELILDADVLSRLTHAAEQWWEGKGPKTVREDIAAGYALLGKLRLHEEANIGRER